ncbi:MAG TPA: hypothetical protein DDW52_19575 [Planctomycetaceae bacterium]|nr:hypothetical protein [Planctomycetaceae bacterium]
MFRILALSGGGLRGAFAIGVLAEFEKRLDRPLTDYFDLIAGTSTGAITAAALARGTTAAEVQAFYEKHSQAIFSPREPYRPSRVLKTIYPAFRKLVSKRLGANLDHFFQSRYCPFALRESMVDGFGDETLRDATRCRLIIPTVNLTDGETYVFRTPHLNRPRPEYDWKIADIIVAAAAAPTYFPHKEMPDGKAYADGGLWAIDPGVVALAEAARIIDSQTECCGKSEKLDDVHMLSLGTGTSTYTLAPPGGDAGMLFWSRHVAEVMSISQVQGTHLPLRLVLGDRYRHLDFPVPDSSWKLDNTAVTDPLFKLGHETGQNVFTELQPTFFSTPAQA